MINALRNCAKLNYTLLQFQSAIILGLFRVKCSIYLCTVPKERIDNVLLFDIEDNLDDDWGDDSDWLEDLPETDGNCYIYDSDKAVALIAKIMQEKKRGKKSYTKLRNSITNLLDLYSDDSINNEVEYYRQYMTLCDRLAERQKLRMISDKTVIGVGGKFSAGKSKFINAIAGLESLLPEDTKPTTSIPTYIMKNTENSYTANNIYGSACSLTKDQLQAMTHEFYESYHIGFSSFIESIVIGSKNWKIGDELVLLDTPGYNKYDNKVKENLSDKITARDQLKITDFLIWLVDIENGTLNQDDIEFIQQLNISTPILIVFNKCDKKSEEQTKDILRCAYAEIIHSGLKCYGVAAYSSLEEKEYFYTPMCTDSQIRFGLIDSFMKSCARSKSHSNDILSEMKKLNSEFCDEIEQYRKETADRNREFETLINDSENILVIRALAKMWSVTRKKKYDLFLKSTDAQKMYERIITLAKDYLGGIIDE